MNIKLGKYITRNNEVVTVEAVGAGGVYPVQGHSDIHGFMSWTDNGSSYNNGKEHALDLVCHIADAYPHLRAVEKAARTFIQHANTHDGDCDQRTQPEEMRRMSWSRAARRAQREALLDTVDTILAIGGAVMIAAAIVAIAMWRP